MRKGALAAVTARRDWLVAERAKKRQKLEDEIAKTEHELAYTIEAEREGYVCRYSSKALRKLVERKREDLAKMDAEDNR